MSTKTKQQDMASRLLEAHVAYELAQWRQGFQQQDVDALARMLWAWAEHTCIHDLVDADQLESVIVCWLKHSQSSGQLMAVWHRSLDMLRRQGIIGGVRVRDVLSHEKLTEGIALMADLKTLRTRMVSGLLHNPAFTALASHLLYQGIRDYILSDSGALRSIPGVSRLVRGATRSGGRPMASLEAQIEKRVKSHIEANLSGMLSNTQADLNETMTPDRALQLADDIWNKVADEKLGEHAALEEEELRRLTGFALELWQEFQQTDYAETMITGLLNDWLQYYGPCSVADWLGCLGLTRGKLTTELESLALPIVESLLESGVLEQLIRHRLAGFYGSDTCAEICRFS